MKCLFVNSENIFFKYLFLNVYLHQTKKRSDYIIHSINILYTLYTFNCISNIPSIKQILSSLALRPIILLLIRIPQNAEYYLIFGGVFASQNSVYRFSGKLNQITEISQIFNSENKLSLSLSLYIHIYIRYYISIVSNRPLIKKCKFN